MVELFKRRYCYISLDVLFSLTFNPIGFRILLFFLYVNFFVYQ